MKSFSYKLVLKSTSTQVALVMWTIKTVHQRIGEKLKKGPKPALGYKAPGALQFWWDHDTKAAL